MAERAAAAAYAAWFETLTPASLAELGDRVTDDIHFRDPFNDVRGVAALRRIFEDMFARLDSPSFTVDDIAEGEQATYLRWRFRFRDGRGRAVEIDGMSEIRFAEDGRVCEHIDHWDAAGQLYERMPILGPVLRILRRRLAG